jgi:hypothetical protein
VGTSYPPKGGVLPLAHINYEGIRKFFYAGTPLSVEKGRRFQETSEGFYFTSQFNCAEYKASPSTTRVCLIERLTYSHIGFYES